MTMFIGRTRETDSIKQFISNISKMGLGYLSVVGKSGIGKTRLLEWARNYATLNNIFVTPVLDLGTTENRSKLSLLIKIADSLSDNSGTFNAFFNAVKEYEIAKDIEKNYRFEILQDVFIKSLGEFSKNSTTLILLDTFETTQNQGGNFPLSEIIPKFTGNIGIILAGRNTIEIALENKFELLLKPFNIEEVRELARGIYSARGCDFDLDDGIIYRIHSRALGHPILVTLAIEWMLENFIPDELLATNQLFEQSLVQFLPKLRDRQESNAILTMATADRRFDEDVARILMKSDEVNELFSNLLRFSFIKHRVDNGKNVFSLHDEMRRLINRYVDFSGQFKDELRKSLVKEFYYPRISLSKTKLERQTLVTELIHYLSFFNTQQAITLFNTELQKSISEYEFDYADLLLREISSTFSEIEDTHPYYITREYKDWIEIGKAELYNKKYKPQDAKTILDGLYLRVASFTPEMKYRLYSNIGAAMINPSTTLEANLFDAIYYWQLALEESKSDALRHFRGEVLYHLAGTHVLVGQHDDALRIFDDALDFARKNQDKVLEAKILNELGKLYRIRMEPNLAKDPIEESMAIRKAIGDEKNLGINYYYLGNLYRDLDNFDDAINFYQMANASLLEIGDQNALCELYCDMSWFYVLSEKWDLAAHYNLLSQQIADKYLFGREISENMHIMYHLEMEKENFDLAFDYVKKAYEVAKKYLNVYMILDCLMHLAQRAYRDEEFYMVPQILSEMESLEKIGCGIKVFTGRTINVQGDCLYAQNLYEDAFESWKSGFSIIALHGNSRTNIEIFDDHFNSREQKLKDVMIFCGRKKIEEFRDYWRENIIKKGFSFHQIIDLCNSALKDL